MAGFAFDFNKTPAPGASKAYGYITLDTLEGLGQPRDYNELSDLAPATFPIQPHCTAVICRA